MKSINPVKLRQISFLIILVVWGGLLFWELKTFLPAFLGAITFYVLLRKWFFLLNEEKKWSKGKAATTLLLLTFFIFLVPIGLMVELLSGKIAYLITHSGEVFSSLATAVGGLEKKYNLRLATDERIKEAGLWLAAQLPNLVGATFNIFTTLLALFFFLYFLLVEGRQIEQLVKAHLPLKPENQQLLRSELREMVFSNAIGIPLLAFFQGFVGLIGYLIIGVPEPFFWATFTFIAGMIPFVGAALAYVPLGLLLLAQGHQVQAIILLVFGFGVIGSIDNVVRMLIQKKLGDIHPTITVFGVIIGLDLFGFFGLIFGPILISLFFLFVKIYFNEFFEHKEVLELTDVEELR